MYKSIISHSLSIEIKIVKENNNRKKKIFILSLIEVIKHNNVYNK
jgi:hypothetical protein